MELVAKIAEERQLLAAVLTCTGLLVPTHLGATGAANQESRANEQISIIKPTQPEPWGQKRPRANTTTTLSMRPPPKPAMDGLYEGKHMKKYNIFMLRMKNHFLRYTG